MWCFDDSVGSGPLWVGSNERADVEEKKASAGSVIVQLPFSRVDTTTLFTTILRGTVTNYWAHPDHRHGWLHWLAPDCRFQLPPGTRRSHASLFYRLQLGVAFTHFYQHLIGSASDPDCDVCHITETFNMFSAAPLAVCISMES